MEDHRQLHTGAQSHEPRRALILDPAGNLWGSERVLLDLMRAVRGNGGWELGLCCPPRSPLQQAATDLGFRVFPVFEANLHRKGRLRRAVAGGALLATIARFRPHVLHVNQAGATRLALLSAAPHRVPVVSHVRLAEDVQYVSRLRSPRRLTAVVCVSRFIEGLFRTAGSLTDRLVPIYDPYAPSLDWDAPLPTPPSRPVFGCTGRLARGKGQDLLLRALALLAPDAPGLQAVFLGAGAAHDPFPAELEALARELGLAAQVEWRGQHPDPISVMGGFTAQVVPSHVESLGRVVFEAWDAGIVPIAWSGSGGPAETITASGGGLLYGEQTPEGLCRTLREAMALTAAQREELVRRGRRWLVAHCSPGKVVEPLLRTWEASTLPAGAGVALAP